MSLAGCASVEPTTIPAPPPAVEPPTAVVRPPVADPVRDEAVIRDLRHQVERLTAQLTDAQRRYATLNEDHRRGEAALRDSQRKVDELQQKLDALLAIDRDTRRRPKPTVK
jgi:chromosome segregation ATPase